jgi:hypothetical protein
MAMSDAGLPMSMRDSALPMSDAGPPMSDAGLPPWVPPPGHIGVASPSTLSDVDPCPTHDCIYSRVEKQAGMFDWCGMAFAPSLGPLGSIVVFGGGHDNYWGNEVYRYDMSTRLFTRVREPYTGMVVGPSGYHTDFETCEYYADASGTIAGTELDREPFMSHTYDGVQWIPGADAGNTHGYVTMAFQQWKPTSGGRQRHWVNLDTMKWERMGIQTSGSFSDHPACYDSVRKQMVIIGTGDPSNTFWRMPLATKVWETFGLPHGIPGTGNLDYAARHDCFLHLRPETVDGVFQPRLRVYSAESPEVPTTPIMLGTPPPLWASGPARRYGGSEWVESKNAFFFYEGDGGKTVYKCAPTGDAFTDPWMWTSETLTFEGAVPVQHANIEHYSRFRHVPALDAFCWLASTTTPVHLFRPATLL